MDDAELTIGQVAKRAGLNVSAIRFYEAEGLLPEARAGERAGAATRRTSSPGWAVIDVAKRAGFSLDEIRTLLGGARCRRARSRVAQGARRRRLPEVEELIERAEAVRRLAPGGERVRLRDARRTARLFGTGAAAAALVRRR